MATTPVVRPTWAPSTDATASNPQEKAVITFLNEWKNHNGSTFGPIVDKYFTQDCHYINMPSTLQPAYGVEAVKASIAGFLDLFAEIDIITLRISSTDGIVMTERIDRLTYQGKTYDLLLMGIFEMEGTRIKAWRDYLDLNDVEQALGVQLH